MKDLFYSNNVHKKFITFLIFIFSFSMAEMFLTSSAEASTLYLSPGKTSVPSGSTVSVSVGLNTSGESVNGVSAYLSYPSDKVEVVGIYYGGSFSIAAEGTYGGGAVRISRGSISGVVGNVTVATITFKGKAQGTANVSFTGGSAAARTSDSSDSLTGSSGGTITVGPLAPYYTPSTATPQDASISTPSDAVKPLITSVVVSSVSTNSATITWKTNEEADSVVEYGLDKDRYFVESVNEEATLSHSVKLEGPILIPGALLHFRVKSKDEAGNEAVSPNQTLRLKGYSVKITVLDSEGSPVPDVDVTLYSEPTTSRTDPNGNAYFTDVTPGEHLVLVKLKNGIGITRNINVQDADDTTVRQGFTVPVDSSFLKRDATIYLFAGIMIILVLIAAGAVVLYMKTRKQNMPANESVEQ